MPMSRWNGLERALRSYSGVEVSTLEPMARHTTLQVGGPADLFIRVKTLKGLEEVLETLAREGCPYIVLGAGTNLLVTDDGVEGAVVVLDGDFRAFSVEGATLKARAAARLVKVLKAIREASMGGLDFLTGIPGTVGGAVVMNGGTRWGSIGDALETITIATPYGVSSLSAGELHLSYRHCDLPEGAVVTEAILRLRPKRTEEDERIKAEIERHRKNNQPKAKGTAGSFFKNPGEGLYAGRLIEEAGLKGVRVGKAFVSPIHANFLTNGGGARALDILELASFVRAEVMKRFGVRLEPEVRIVGRGAKEWVERLTS